MPNWVHYLPNLGRDISFLNEEGAEGMRNRQYTHSHRPAPPEPLTAFA